MLALFKPWRSGLELKAQEQTWDDTFSTHSFSVRQMDTMKNLNIQYECLDEQDDFHVQLNKGDRIGFSSWEDADVVTMQDMEEITVNVGINDIQDDSNVKHHVAELSDKLGK